jgi:hypothetical protein
LAEDGTKIEESDDPSRPFDEENTIQEIYLNPISYQI